MSLSSKNITVLESSAGTVSASTAHAESPHAHPPLPEEPLVIIERTESWVAVNFRDLWAYRGLLYFLIWRDLKVRYKQTVLGIAWVIMQPLLATFIFTIFLGMLARVSSDGLPYPLFVYAGLLPWTFFSSAVTTSSNSLVGNAHLITKVYFPRMLIPAAAISGRLVDFAIAFVILIGLMIYYGMAVTKQIVMLPPLIILVTLFAFGFGMLLSAFNVKYRDVGAILPVVIQLWMFASPVLYPMSLVPQKWQVLFALNPIVGITEGFRASLFGQEFNWVALTFSFVVTLILLVCSAYTFQRMEKSFADTV